jgi:hypothetical protein
MKTNNGWVSLESSMVAALQCDISLDRKLAAIESLTQSQRQINGDVPLRESRHTPAKKGSHYARLLESEGRARTEVRKNPFDPSIRAERAKAFASRITRRW